jgi:hypothetical protein
MYQPAGIAPTLDIISARLPNAGQLMRKYRFDPGIGQSIDHVGVFGDEPFAIRITAANKRLGIRVSVDGTDIATGQKALTGYGGPGTFIVEPYRNSTFEAWVETNKSGAQFVFSSVENSVAAHTHGDLTAKGYISVLWHYEGYEPPRYENYTSKGLLGGGPTYRSATRGGLESLSMNAGPAVGAGRTIEQNIGTTRGLSQPVHGGVVQVRYMWWTELCELMASRGVQPNGSMYPSGFFEPTRPMANLGNTPRLFDAGDIRALAAATLAAREAQTPPPVTERYLRF